MLLQLAFWAGEHAVDAVHVRAPQDGCPGGQCE